MKRECTYCLITKNTHKYCHDTVAKKTVTIIKLEFAIFDRPQIPILAINLMRDTTDTTLNEKVKQLKQVNQLNENE